MAQPRRHITDPKALASKSVWAKSVWSKFGHSLKALRRQEAGSVAVISAVVMFVLVSSIGAAVDYSQAVSVRKALATALDSATLATARDLSFGRITEAQAAGYLQTHFDRSYDVNGSKARSEQDPLEIDIDPQLGKVKARANAEMPTAFMGLAGFATLDIGVASTASYVQEKLDIALVVDVTGSMTKRADGAAMTKMAELRAAVRDDFLTALFGDITGKAADERIRVSLVPYSVGVDVSETTPKSYRALSNTCMAEKGVDDMEASKPSLDILIGNAAYCPGKASLIPLTNNPKAIIDRLNQISPSGYTAGHVGLLWGWNTLSGSWADEWPAASAPLRDGDGAVRKIVVFMTDGAFNTKYERTGVRIENGRRVAELNYQSAQNRQAGLGRQGSVKRARQACAEMSKAGITVYTIAFALKSGSSAEDVMRDCATVEREHFFEADGGELGAVFDAIANDVKRIWLSS